jgi:hypothetical protein
VVSVDFRKTKIKNNKQFVIMLAAMIADFVWLYTPMLLFLIFVAPLGSLDGALGEGFGFVLIIVIGVCLTRLWSPLAWKISAPLIEKLAKRIGVTGEKEE